MTTYMSGRRQIVVFTIQELVNSQRGFSHLIYDKRLYFLKLSSPQEADNERADTLEEIVNCCRNFQNFGPLPGRLNASKPSKENLKFSDELSIDLMFKNGKATQDTEEDDTICSTATFLDSRGENYGQYRKYIWIALIQCWCTMYT